MTRVFYCGDCDAGPFGKRGLALHRRKRHVEPATGGNRAQRRGSRKAEHTLQTLPRTVVSRKAAGWQVKG